MEALWCVLPPLTRYAGAPPQGEPFGTPRRRPLRGEMDFVRGGFRDAEGVVPYEVKWILCAREPFGGSLRDRVGRDFVRGGWFFHKFLKI